METGISIQANVTKESVDAVAKTIERIFQVGYRTHMDQETIRAALESIAKTFSVSGTMISGCNVDGGKTITN